MGGNRVNLIEEPGDENLAVPVLEVYYPPYFFLGARPVINRSPSVIALGQKFNVTVENANITSVVLCRTGLITHNWAWDNHRVSLSFDSRYNRLEVDVPSLPGLLIPGDYLLFVVDSKRVPSDGVHVRVCYDPSCNTGGQRVCEDDKIDT